MNFELKGTLIEKFNTQQISDKFKKREFVVETRENNNGMEFIETIKFQLTQDKCAILDNINLNEKIKVTFNIRGRKWEKDGTVNYFTNLEAWKIEKDSASTVMDAPQDFQYQSVDIPTEDDSDLPF